MLAKMQIYRAPGMVVEKERSRNVGGSRLSENSKKGKNYEPSEERTIIKQSSEFVYCSC
jgi:hypothetical protein